MCRHPSIGCNSIFIFITLDNCRVIVDLVVVNLTGRDCHRIDHLRVNRDLQLDALIFLEPAPTVNIALRTSNADNHYSGCWNAHKQGDISDETVGSSLLEELLFSYGEADLEFDDFTDDQIDWSRTTENYLCESCQPVVIICSMGV